MNRSLRLHVWFDWQPQRIGDVSPGWVAAYSRLVGNIKFEGLFLVIGIYLRLVNIMIETISVLSWAFVR
jgi:hypothetical protein